jgi:hypothetical protein
MKHIILFSILSFATSQTIAMHTENSTPNIPLEFVHAQTNEIARLQKLVETYRINCTRLAQVVSDQKSALAKQEAELKQKDSAIAAYQKYNQSVQCSLESMSKILNLKK